MRLLYPIFLGCLFAAAACQSVAVRKDPFASPQDTGKPSLQVIACGQAGTSVGCSLVSGEDFSKRVVTILAPLAGTLDVIGCNTQSNVNVPNPGPFSFTLPDFSGGECIYDFTYNWRLPSNFSSEEPVRSLYGKLFVVRLSAGALPASLKWASNASQEGVGTLQTGENPAFLSGLTDQNELQITVTKAAIGQGVFRLFGCGLGLSGVPFTGQVIALTLSKLLGPTWAKGECLLFGWAVDGAGLNDEFSLGLTVHADTEPVAASAWLSNKNKQICYQADPHVTIVTYGAKWSNELKACFDATASEWVSFYTVRGRAAHVKVGL